MSSPLEEMLRFNQPADRRQEEPYSQAQACQVYRFTASLQYRPGLWRRLEIQGGQTLAEASGLGSRALHCLGFPDDDICIINRLTGPLV